MSFVARTAQPWRFSGLCTPSLYRAVRAPQRVPTRPAPRRGWQLKVASDGKCLLPEVRRPRVRRQRRLSVDSCRDRLAARERLPVRVDIAAASGTEPPLLRTVRVGNGPPTLQPMRQPIHTAAAIQGRANHTPRAKPMRSERIAVKSVRRREREHARDATRTKRPRPKEGLAPPADVP
jgi:hypothetical protein